MNFRKIFLNQSHKLLKMFPKTETFLEIFLNSQNSALPHEKYFFIILKVAQWQ